MEVKDKEVVDIRQLLVEMLEKKNGAEFFCISDLGMTRDGGEKLLFYHLSGRMESMTITETSDSRMTADIRIHCDGDSAIQTAEDFVRMLKPKRGKIIEIVKAGMRYLDI